MVSAYDLCFADNLAQQNKVKMIGRDAMDYWLASCYLFTKNIIYSKTLHASASHENSTKVYIHLNIHLSTIQTHTV